MSEVTTPSTERLDERLKHLMETVGEIKARLDQVPTRGEIAALVSRSEHSAAVVALETRIATLETRAQESSPRSRLSLVREIALTIAAVGAAGVLVQALVHWIDRVPK